MKVFAEQDSEDLSVFNIQLATWRIAIGRWRDVEREDLDFNEFFEEACVILVLAGTSVSQLLGQNTRENASTKVPSVPHLVNELVGDDTLRATLQEFNAVYEDLRHFGKPKHPKVIMIDGAHFTKWMLAMQQLWVELGRPREALEQEAFSETFDVEWIEEED